MNSVFSLRALAAQKMPQVSNYLGCQASGKPAIHASRSKTNSANSLSADKVTMRVQDCLLKSGEGGNGTALFDVKISVLLKAFIGGGS